MLLDALTLFSDNQAITGTAVSASVYDSGGADAKIGDGNPLSVSAKVTEDFNNLTSLQVSLQHSDVVGSGYEDVLAGEDIPIADIDPGKDLFPVKLPKGLKRFLRLNYTVTGTNPTTGAITAGIHLGD